MKRIIRIMNRLKMIPAITIIFYAGTIISCKQNTCLRFTIDVSQPGALVADICRGQQIEEFNHQFEGGLYAQLINNPSFEELKNPIAEWFLVKTGSSDGALIVLYFC